MIFFFGGGGGGAGGGRFQLKKRKHKNNTHSLIFSAHHALYKISSSWLKWFSRFNRNKRSNGQVRSITQPMFYRIQPKVILTWILNNLQDPSSSNSLHIVLTRFFSIFIKAKSKKGHNSINVLPNSLKS